MEQNFLTISDFSANKSSELYITFNLSEKFYAIPADKVIEIVQLPALTLLEKAPEYMVGLLNLRGNIISIIDLSMILGFARKSYSTEQQILILDINDKKIGIIVDFVRDVVPFDKKNLEPLPYETKEHIVEGIYKDESSLVAFLDLDKIVQGLQIIEEHDSEIKETALDITGLFPVDPESKEKFAKRALKLRKELRDDSNRLNYHEDYFISFGLNAEIYCINLKFVREITKLKLVNLTKVPCVPDFISGIINLRGDFITIVDIKEFLHIPKTNITEKTKIIVVRTENLQVGILVDEVFGIENLPHDKFNHHSQSKYEKNKFTSAEIMLNDKIMCVFDLKKFLEDERLIIEDAV